MLIVFDVDVGTATHPTANGSIIGSEHEITVGLAHGLSEGLAVGVKVTGCKVGMNVGLGVGWAEQWLMGLK